MIAWAGALRFEAGLVDGLDAPARALAARPRRREGAARRRGQGVNDRRRRRRRRGTALAAGRRRRGERLDLGARARGRRGDQARPRTALSCRGLKLEPGDPRDRRSRRDWPVRRLPRRHPGQHLRAVAAGLPARGGRWCSAPRGSRRQRAADARGRRRGAAGPRRSRCFPGRPSRMVAAGLPTAVTLAAGDRALGERLIARLARPAFRPYYSDDIAGAEVGGAVKNVLAIACGVVEGRGLGQNARAALISRGFAEMTRFGLAKARAPRRWPAWPASATSCSPARRPARAISASARASARARPGRPARRPAHRRRGRLHRAGAEARRRGARRRHADRRRGLRALLAGQASVDEVVDRPSSRPSAARPRAADWRPVRCAQKSQQIPLFSQSP